LRQIGNSDARINQAFTNKEYECYGRRFCVKLASHIDTPRYLQNTPRVFLMSKKLKDFLADESGATAIEYGLIAAGISLAIIAVVNGLGAKLNTKFTSINASLK
jgi:pilus assembly protein Flp/PilA